MKMSLCQMIAIACILTVGFMTVSPFVQEGFADGYAHSYTVPADIVAITSCEVCGIHVSSEKIDTVEMTTFHADGGTHALSGTIYLYYEDGWCGAESCFVSMG